MKTSFFDLFPLKAFFRRTGNSMAHHNMAFLFKYVLKIEANSISSSYEKAWSKRHSEPHLPENLSMVFLKPNHQLCVSLFVF